MNDLLMTIHPGQTPSVTSMAVITVAGHDGMMLNISGPSPATSDSRATIVGAVAIDRFLRPVCYQVLSPGVAARTATGQKSATPVAVGRWKDAAAPRRSD